MAKINTYDQDPAISAGDKLIGTDVDNLNATANFSIESIIDYLNAISAIQMQALKYAYQAWDVGQTREDGTISFQAFEGNTVAFSTITEFMLSGETLNGESVYPFYTSALENNYILITNAQNPSNWAVFIVTNVVVNGLQPTFFDITLTYVDGLGSLVDTDLYLVSLLQITGADADKNFTYEQVVPSASWVIIHNLSKYPAVSVFDGAGVLVEGTVTYDTVNQVTLTFSTAISGTVTCN